MQKSLRQTTPVVAFRSEVGGPAPDTRPQPGDVGWPEQVDSPSLPSGETCRGFLFALLVLAISVVSFPLLLDRDVGLPTVVLTSVRTLLINPRTMAVWGLLVAAGLAVGSLPFFIGLVIVVPVLGHATWHLYRRAIV